MTICLWYYSLKVEAGIHQYDCFNDEIRGINTPDLFFVVKEMFFVVYDQLMYFIDKKEGGLYILFCMERITKQLKTRYQIVLYIIKRGNLEIKR